MKKIFLLLMLISLAVLAQQKNKHVVDRESGKQMLIGSCDRTAFADTSYSWWFNSEYENYTPDSLVIKKLKPALGNTIISIVMGSWCSDSRREVPRLFKILDATGFDSIKLNMICVDRDKKFPEGDIEKLDIKLVPTFIFYKDGKELGRIQESPKKKLEEDIQEILFN